MEICVIIRVIFAKQHHLGKLSAEIKKLTFDERYATHRAQLTLQLEPIIINEVRQ